MGFYSPTMERLLTNKNSSDWKQSTRGPLYSWMLSVLPSTSSCGTTCKTTALGKGFGTGSWWHWWFWRWWADDDVSPSGTHDVNLSKAAFIRKAVCMLLVIALTTSTSYFNKHVQSGTAFLCRCWTLSKCRQSWPYGKKGEAWLRWRKIVKRNKLLQKLSKRRTPAGQRGWVWKGPGKPQERWCIGSWELVDPWEGGKSWIGYLLSFSMA